MVVRAVLTAVCAAALFLGVAQSSDDAMREIPVVRGAPAAYNGPPPGWVAGAAARRAVVPILMYHVVGHPAGGAAQPGLVTSPRRFAAQVRALAEAGYTAVRLDRVLAAWDGRAALPPRPVVITFDDGYPGHLTYAAPTLRRHGWPAVLNLEMRNVGDDGLPGWAVRRLIGQGWEIASHTVTHADLRTLDDDQLADELLLSRIALRTAFGVEADVLCYPAGKYDARVLRAARTAGYRAATTVREGIATAASPRLELPRVRADGQLAPGALLRRIRAAARARPDPAR